MIDLILQVIKIIKERYSDLYLDYEYVLEDGFYDIFHDNFELDSNEEFSSFICELLSNTFYDIGMYNVSFGYEYKKSTLSKQKRAIELCLEKVTIKPRTSVKMRFDFVRPGIESYMLGTYSDPMCA